MLTGTAVAVPAELAPISELCRRAQDEEAPADALRAIRALRERLADMEAAHVAALIGAGATWATVAQALGVSRQAAHRRFQHLPATRPAPAAASTDVRRILVTSEARAAVRLSREEAVAQRAPAIGTEHLLLGLLRSDAAAAARALRGAGVEEDAARRALQPTIVEDGDLSPADGGFTRHAREVLEGTLREAVERGEGFIGPDHLLLALLRNPQGGAARTLEALGVEPESVRLELERG